jgi:hypothetical protein
MWRFRTFEESGDGEKRGRDSSCRLGGAAMSAEDQDRVQAEIEQAKAMVALIFAITPSEAVGLLSLAVDQRGWSLATVARAVLDLSRQPRGGDLDLVRHRFTLLLFSHMAVDALVERADGHRRADLAKVHAAS